MPPLTPLIGSLALMVPALVGAAPEPGPVSQRDFFLYSCVQEYRTLIGQTHLDASMAYAVEHSSFSAETLQRIYSAAATFARRIPLARADASEHGQPAALALCQGQSKRYPDLP